MSRELHCPMDQYETETRKDKKRKGKEREGQETKKRRDSAPLITTRATCPAHKEESVQVGSRTTQGVYVRVGAHNVCWVTS